MPSATPADVLARRRQLMLNGDADADKAAAWTALVDPNQLTTAVLNLALNARDAMKDAAAFLKRHW